LRLCPEYAAVYLKKNCPPGENDDRENRGAPATARPGIPAVIIGGVALRIHAARA